MRTDPAIVAAVPVLLLSVVAHECAHALAALACGDRTARERGRLTLNPIPHLDLWGTLVVPGILLATHAPALFGWGRPAPIEGANLRDLRNDRAKIALAGPLANVALALAFAALARLAAAAEPFAPLAPLAYAGVVVNCALALFHLLPIPPLDGAWVLMRFLRLRHIVALHHLRLAAILVVAALVLSPLTAGAVLGAPVHAARGVLELFGVPATGVAP